MLQLVDLAPKSLERYSEIVGSGEVERLRELARPLQGASVCHINATAYGGGVSELLRSVVPLYRSLGLQADWRIIPGTEEFFRVTKSFHNALQGAPMELTPQARDTYMRHSHHIASLLGTRYDFVIVHDPQPAALRALRPDAGSRWVWRCHIDTSEPNRQVLEFLIPLLREYDALVFTMSQFIPPGLDHPHTATIPPGIDPLSPKNMALAKELCHQIIAWFGVDPQRPLITQVSRFDPWKDPLGVIQVYRLVRRQVPEVQLALLGQMALDDPQGWDMYHDIVATIGFDPDIHVLTNFTGVGNIEVNAFQRASDVVLQKSLREGFGLVVSESLWKATPVVAGRAGGIPLQMPPGVGGYLVDSVEEAAEKVVRLLRHPEEARQLGRRGQDHVRRHFLVTRLLADELKLLASLR